MFIKSVSDTKLVASFNDNQIYATGTYGVYI